MVETIRMDVWPPTSQTNLKPPGVSMSAAASFSRLASPMRISKFTAPWRVITPQICRVVTWLYSIPWNRWYIASAASSFSQFARFRSKRSISLARKGCGGFLAAMHVILLIKGSTHGEMTCLNGYCSRARFALVDVDLFPQNVRHEASVKQFASVALRSH